MTERWDERTRTLLGEDAVNQLARKRVLIVGCGGVGGYASEMLARSGVGHLTLIDSDCVATSNINRQIIATHDTVGESKVELLAKRFKSINPDISVDARQLFLTPEKVDDLISENYDMIIDAIDSVAPKVMLLEESLRRHIPVVSSMGAGGRIDPTKCGYFDISETRNDGLAREVRRRLRKAGFSGGLTVVASTESPEQHSILTLDEQFKRSSYGTLATIPAIFGIMLANRAILELLSRPDSL